MRERVELLLGRRVRAMWVMTFHAACARMLRAEAAAPGLHPPVHDLRPGRLAPAGQALPRRARHRPQALHARLPSTPRSPTPRTSCATPTTTRQIVGSFFEQTVADVYQLYEREMHRMNAMDFDDLLVRAVNVLELFPEVRERYADGVPPRPRRRVPGHQPRPVPLAPAARPGERTANLTVVGDDAQSIYGFRGADIRNILDFEDDFPTRTSSSSSRTTARRRRSSTPPTRSSRNNRGQMPKYLWTELGQGDPIKVRELDDEHAEARFVVRRDPAARRRGRLARGDRGLLPDQRAVAGARGHAGARARSPTR